MIHWWVVLISDMDTSLIAFQSPNNLELSSILTTWDHMMTCCLWSSMLPLTSNWSMVDTNRHGETAERSGFAPVFSMQIVGIAGRTGMSLHQQHFRRLWSTTIGLGFLGFGRLDTFFLKRFFTVLEDWLYMGKGDVIQWVYWDKLGELRSITCFFFPCFFFPNDLPLTISRRFFLGDFFHIRVQFNNSGDWVVGPRKCFGGRS